MEITKLYSPLSVSLYEKQYFSENLYDSTLPEVFIETINKAIRKNTFTRANENGLIHYFLSDNEAYEAFINEHVKYAHPTVQNVNNSLHIVLEIGSDLILPTEIIDAIKDSMELLYVYQWGAKVENITIPLQGAALYEPDSRLGLREDMERQHPNYPFRLLNNPSLILHICDLEQFYIKTEAELQAVGKNIETAIEETEHTESAVKPIKAYIRKDNGDLPDDYAGIFLPTTAKDLQAALERLNFKPQDIDRCVIEGITAKSITAGVKKYIPDCISLIAIDRLNYMAGEIQKISDDDLLQQKLAAAFTWAGDGFDAYPKIIGIPFESDSLDDVLNVILNLDNFTLRQSIIREEDLGEQVIREEIEAGIRTHDEINEYFDYDDYAYEIANKQNGLFYGGYYVACSSFTHYMEMDNAVPKISRVWVEAVANFLPESERNKGFEYFRPNIDYTALVEGKTGVATLDLAAKIENFCRAARVSGFSYDGSDFEARGRTIIEIAYMCEKRDRDKSVIAILDDAAEHLLVVPDAVQDDDYATLTNLKAALYSLEKELETQVQSEFEGGHCGDDERLISGIVTEYPENMRSDPALLTLLVNRELHRHGIETILEQLNKSNMIDEPSSDVNLFQLLPSDLQVQLEIEHDLMHQLAQVKIAHENRIIDLYDKEIAVCQNSRFQQKVLPATKSREQTQKRQSFTERLQELSEKVKKESPRTNDKSRNKNNSL